MVTRKRFIVTVTRVLSCYKTTALRFMEFRYLLGFHSGINDPHFLLLHEGTLLGNWLQACRETVGGCRETVGVCRETVGGSFSKDQMPNSVLPVQDMTTIYQQIIQQTITQ